MTPSVECLAQEIVRGSTRALARGLTLVEQGGPSAEALSERLYGQAGGAHVVGITGSPGTGKSTLVCGLARSARARGLSVGIVAVDPSSPFSGGSILGDRIRMNDLSLDRGVFIRSMATRGALGGLCPAVADSIDLMDAAGRKLVIVETVGVGQDEVDIMEIAHTVAVVSVPGLGDDIQTLKAGILEIADLHVVNKADRHEASRLVADLRSISLLAPPVERAWIPPILSCVAVREEGIEPILDALFQHAAALRESGELESRRRRIARARVLRIAQQLFKSAIASIGDYSEAILERVARRDIGPHACARALLAAMAASKDAPRGTADPLHFQETSTQ
ncbi:MAG: methylmalonyl Co-A mutase-associated GTPase MeaB [Acidobacteria bacterium]|nr:methylmalonyl Co-A mutase-associated GTPase MeaB [Acidobacteriota bacterium]